MIVKVKGGYEVRSESGKSLGKYKSRAAAKKRLAQVEMFKHMESENSNWVESVFGAAEYPRDERTPAMRAADCANDSTYSAMNASRKANQKPDLLGHHKVAASTHEMAAEDNSLAAKENEGTPHMAAFYKTMADNHTALAAHHKSFASKKSEHFVAPVTIKENKETK